MFNHASRQVRQRNLFAIILCTMAAACSSTDTLNDIETQARSRMAVADTLEQAKAWKEATREYTFIARQFPSSSVYQTAVWKAALLYSTPENPIASDSASAHWFRVYQSFSPSTEEKALIQMYLGAIERTRRLRDSLLVLKNTGDSLAVAARKQSSELSARAKRILELETQLQKTSDELLKLKEIDMRISKSREKNKP